MAGKKNWFIVDGYKPPLQEGGDQSYVGHECIMILNTTQQDAHCTIDVYFSDKDPVMGLSYTAPAQRISAFYSNDEKVFRGVPLGEGVQYSLQISSDVDVIVQYGRMDVNQKNLAYIALLGHAE